VRDASNSRPIQALVRLSPLSQGQDWSLYSAKENGDFHRPLLAGTYSLKFSANGYRDTVLAGIAVPDTVNPVTVAIPMTPGSNYAALRVIGVEQDSLSARANASLTPWTLGVPDDKAYSMSFGGRLFLDMGQGTEIVDGPGPDLRVVEYPSAQDTIQVAVSNAWTGPWFWVGNGVGTSDYDLAGRIGTARYVRIRDLGHGNNAVADAGYDLDAVVALNHAQGVEHSPPHIALRALRLTCHPNPFRTKTTFSLSCPGDQNQSPPALSIYDATGRLVRILNPMSSCEYVWDGTDSKGRTLPGGVYFYRLDSPRSACNQKVVLIR
jgi:hypothetical protein